MLLNLSLWFGLHVLFHEVAERHWGPLRWLAPELASLDVLSAALSLFAMLALFRFHLGVALTLACSAGLGALAELLSQ